MVTGVQGVDYLVNFVEIAVADKDAVLVQPTLPNVVDEFEERHRDVTSSLLATSIRNFVFSFKRTGNENNHYLGKLSF